MKPIKKMVKETKVKVKDFYKEHWLISHFLIGVGLGACVLVGENVVKHSYRKGVMDGADAFVETLMHKCEDNGGKKITYAFSSDDPKLGDLVYEFGVECVGD